MDDSGIENDGQRLGRETVTQMLKCLSKAFGDDMDLK